MVAKKAPAKKAVGKKKPRDVTRDLVHKHDMTTHYIPIGDINLLPLNPNTGGSEAALEDSINENGQYRPVILQKSTMTCIAGNHTVELLRAMGATEVACHLFDIDDSEAAKIALADNRIPKLANIDLSVERQLLEQIQDWRGTGFSEEDYTALMKAEASVLDEIQSMETEDVTLAELHRLVDHGGNAGDDHEFGEEDNSVSGKDERNTHDVNDLDKVDSSMNSVFQLGDLVKFPGSGYWEIPILRDDMLVSELPSPLVTWAGSATRDMEGAADNWWFYNYGTDSTSGMTDLSRIFLSFFSWDDYFEKFWYEPGKYIGRALNSGITMAMTPDFSMPDVAEAKVMSLFQHHRNRWVGRYFQEVGIKVIPNVTWPHNDYEFMEKYCLPGTPKNAPYIGLGLVAFSTKQTPEAFALQAQCYRRAIEVLEPQNLFIYTGKAGQEWFESLNIDVPVHWQHARLEALGGKAKKRAEKTTL